MNYENTPTLKKGMIGEAIAREWLEHDLGMVVYTTATERPHDIDLIVMQKGGPWALVEVKVKCERDRYPDQGIDLADFEHYKEVSERLDMPLFLFFVDQCSCQAYGQYLDQLMEPTEIHHNGRKITYPQYFENERVSLIFFPVSKMRPIKNLDQKKCEQIKTI